MLTCSKLLENDANTFVISLSEKTYIDRRTCNTNLDMEVIVIRNKQNEGFTVLHTGKFMLF